MKIASVARAEERAHAARLALAQIINLPPKVPGFEYYWYQFLTSFNSAFTQLEQGSKHCEASKRWHSRIKLFRKTDPLLRYLHHARNAEEHTNIPSIFRTQTTLKPLTKSVKVQYRDSTGRRLERPRIIAKQNTGMQRLKLMSAGIRCRTVVDRGVAYEFPTTYSHPIVTEMINKGVITESGGVVELLTIAISHLDNIIADAKSFCEKEES